MISDVIKDQRTFYQSGATRSYRFRMEALAKLSGRCWSRNCC